MRRSTLFVLACTLAGGQAGAAGNPELGQQKAAVCMACHGPDGNSPALPEPAQPWPKLAGRVPAHIIKQTQGF